MLIYLDQNSSRGPNSVFAQKQSGKGFGLNENLAREAMELHSMGVGAPYTQKDVRELAELLTGLSYNAKGGFSYNPNIAEPGAMAACGASGWTISATPCATSPAGRKRRNMSRASWRCISSRTSRRMLWCRRWRRPGAKPTAI
jgi:uncharacterized protein (DUF1800 family)